MSRELISRNPDLLRLQSEGYEVEVRDGHLLVHSVPYLTAAGKIARGTLVCPLRLVGERVAAPDCHIAHFAGDHPCMKSGAQITSIKHCSSEQEMAGVRVFHSFSNKPPGGYPDYHAKMTRYIEIIEAQARSVDPHVSARTFKPVPTEAEESVFKYHDSASARAGIQELAAKLAMSKVAIVGLGGTGAYVLDLVAKTHVGEIHLFDGDIFYTHNAFRAPGAVSLGELNASIHKVEHFSAIYGKMRRDVVPHGYHITEDNVGELGGFDFVFVCVDSGPVRKLIVDALNISSVPFVDAGMDIHLLSEEKALFGAARVTASWPGRREHVSRHIPMDEAPENDLYRRNIQIADMNMLNAALAVVWWKRYCGFYQDLAQEGQVVYTINTNSLARAEFE